MEYKSLIVDSINFQTADHGIQEQLQRYVLYQQPPTWKLPHLYKNTSCSKQK